MLGQFIENLAVQLERQQERIPRALRPVAQSHRNLLAISSVIGAIPERSVIVGDDTCAGLRQHFRLPLSNQSVVEDDLFPHMSARRRGPAQARKLSLRANDQIAQGESLQG